MPKYTDKMARKLNDYIEVCVELQRTRVEIKVLESKLKALEQHINDPKFDEAFWSIVDKKHELGGYIWRKQCPGSNS